MGIWSKNRYLKWKRTDLVKGDLLAVHDQPRVYKPVITLQLLLHHRHSALNLKKNSMLFYFISYNWPAQIGEHNAGANQVKEKSQRRLPAQRVTNA
jgi:hypothetical protein